MSGFFRIYRAHMRPEVFTNPAMLQVWIYLSMHARFKATVEDGIEILPGQVLLSAGEIASECHMTQDSVRHYLLRFEKLGMINRQSIRNRYTLITILEPDEESTAAAAKPAVCKHKKSACAVPVITEEADVPQMSAVTEKADVSEMPENTPKIACGPNNNVYLTDEENRSLHEKTDVADLYIEKLSAYKKRTGKTYHDDYSVLCEWICEDAIKGKLAAAKQVADQPHREMKQAEKEKKTEVPCRENHYMPGPASYDLASAQAYADTHVPTLRKRRRQGI